MGVSLSDLSGLEQVLLFCALAGGAVFVVRTILQFVGVGGDDGDASLDDDGPLDDSDSAFRALSLHGLSTFFMTFGLFGLAVARTFALHPFAAIAGGAVGGAISVWIVARIFRMATRLQSSGTMDMHNAIGQEGTVYLTIPAGGTGKVRVTVQERLCVLDARAESGREIPTGEKIWVTNVDGSLLIVERS